MHFLIDALYILHNYYIMCFLDTAAYTTSAYVFAFQSLSFFLSKNTFQRNLTALVKYLTAHTYVCSIKNLL